MRETGTTTPGMMVVRGFLRKTNTTRITRPIEITRVRSTSLTEALIVVVWALTTVRPIAEGTDDFNSGNAARTLSTVSMIFAPGWRKIITRAQAFPFASPADLRFSTESWTLATSDNLIAAPLL